MGVVLRGQESEFIASSLSQAPSELSIGLLPQASLLSAGGITANLTVTIVSQLNDSIGWGDTTTFGGNLASPVPATVGNPAIAPPATSGQPRFGGELIDSAVSDLAESGQINGAPATVSPGPGIALVTGSPLAAPVSGARFTIGLKGEPVSVTVRDQDGKGVPGVDLSLSVDGKGLPTGYVTNSTGVARLQMVPWAFDFNATFGGTMVGSTQVDPSTQSAATISANIYTVVLMVKDSRGGSLGGAQVNLQNGNITTAGQTDDQGRYTFEAVSNSVYTLTVGVGGGTYFNGQIDSRINNELVIVTTTYFPPSLQLIIVLLIALVPVALIVAFLAARRLGKRQ